MLLVVGASGYIGSYLYSNIPNQFKACGTSSLGLGDLFPFQLENASNFNFSKIKSGDIVCLIAAISSPDVCAREQERAWAVNVAGTANFIERVIACGGRVIFFSSDTVYGERKEPFDELVQCNPAGEYAEMKVALERLFIGNPLFKSIRLSYVFSKEDKFTKYLSQSAKGGVKADLFHPFYRSIIYRSDVVEGVFALARRWTEFPQQVFNFGGPQVMSRIEFAECLRELALPSLKYRVIEPDSEFFKSRPRIIAMSSETLPMLLGRPPKTLAEAVRMEFK